jgi:hypothetical protein
MLPAFSDPSYRRNRDHEWLADLAFGAPGMLTGGGAVLVALIAFVVLTFSSRKEGEAHGSQTNTSVGNSAGGA